VLSTGFVWPTKRTTVSLAPSAGGRKGGSGLDLAIAVGALVASEQLAPDALDGLAFLGELGLDGSVRPVPGLAPMSAVLDDLDLVVPVAGAREARAAALGAVRGVATLAEVIAALAGAEPWPDHPEPRSRTVDPPPEPDLADVRGQPVARLAVEAAAAGGHHLLLVGPPGSGKSMLASRLPGLLPDLDRPTALAATMIQSAAGLGVPDAGLVVRPPFRAPHHSCSPAAMVGGGSAAIRPGEVSLAHGGVLFLDELALFGPAVLNHLREPLETREVHLDRAQVHTVIPADTLLVAAMNPCPCGGGAPGRCHCVDSAVQRYQQRVSGPLLDRFDLRVLVDRPRVDDLLSGEPGESTVIVRARVAAARALAVSRQGVPNAKLRPSELDAAAPLDPAAKAILRREVELDRLSARGYDRIRRVARTLVDLRDPGRDLIGEHDVAAALALRTGLRPRRSIGWVA
jgi:magnesium chelatase family protein